MEFTGYEYDAANNPTKIGSTTYTYDAANQLKTGGSTSYGFDQLGERTTATPQAGQTTTYGYDQAGDLLQVKQGKAGGLNVNYAYNGDGLRTSQTKGKTTSFLTWDMHSGLPLIINDEQNSYIYGPDGIPIEQIQSKGAALYLHHDQQGSTQMLTSSTGAVEETTTYDAYGNLTATTGTTATPLGYDAQYTNTDTGLIYLRARVYDPATAQFLNTDPIQPITRAPYNYAHEDPLTFKDPAGLESLWDDFTGTVEAIPDTIASGESGEFFWNEVKGFVGGFVGANTSCLSPGGGIGALLGGGKTEGLGGDFSTFRRNANGQIDHYTTYSPNPRNPNGYEASKRFDRVGRDHYNKVYGERVETPHVHEKDTPGGVRPAEPDEIPIEIP